MGNGGNSRQIEIAIPIKADAGFSFELGTSDAKEFLGLSLGAQVKYEIRATDKLAIITLKIRHFDRLKQLYSKINPETLKWAAEIETTTFSLDLKIDVTLTGHDTAKSLRIPLLEIFNALKKGDPRLEEEKKLDGDVSPGVSLEAIEPAESTVEGDPWDHFPTKLDDQSIGGVIGKIVGIPDGATTLHVAVANWGELLQEVAPGAKSGTEVNAFRPDYTDSSSKPSSTFENVFAPNAFGPLSVNFAMCLRLREVSSDGKLKHPSQVSTTPSNNDHIIFEDLDPGKSYQLCFHTHSIGDENSESASSDGGDDETEFRKALKDYGGHPHAFRGTLAIRSNDKQPWRAYVFLCPKAKIRKYILLESGNGRYNLMQEGGTADKYVTELTRMAFGEFLNTKGVKNEDLTDDIANRIFPGGSVLPDWGKVSVKDSEFWVGIRLLGDPKDIVDYHKIAPRGKKEDLPKRLTDAILSQYRDVKEIKTETKIFSIKVAREIDRFEIKTTIKFPGSDSKKDNMLVACAIKPDFTHRLILDLGAYSTEAAWNQPPANGVTEYLKLSRDDKNEIDSNAGQTASLHPDTHLKHLEGTQPKAENNSVSNLHRLTGFGDENMDINGLARINRVQKESSFATNGVWLSSKQKKENPKTWRQTLKTLIDCNIVPLSARQLQKARRDKDTDLVQLIVTHPASISYPDREKFHQTIEELSVRLNSRLHAGDAEKAKKKVKLRSMSIMLVPEPLAAAYHLRETSGKDGRLIAIDAGHSTLDFTVVKQPPKNEKNVWPDWEPVHCFGLPACGRFIDIALLHGMSKVIAQLCSTADIDELRQFFPSVTSPDMTTRAEAIYEEIAASLPPREDPAGVALCAGLFMPRKSRITDQHNDDHALRLAKARTNAMLFEVRDAKHASSGDSFEFKLCTKKQKNIALFSTEFCTFLARIASSSVSKDASKDFVFKGRLSELMQPMLGPYLEMVEKIVASLCTNNGNDLVTMTVSGDAQKFGPFKKAIEDGCNSKATVVNKEKDAVLKGGLGLSMNLSLCALSFEPELYLVMKQGDKIVDVYQLGKSKTEGVTDKDFDKVVLASGPPWAMEWFDELKGHSQIDLLVSVLFRQIKEEKVETMEGKKQFSVELSDREILHVDVPFIQSGSYEYLRKVTANFSMGNHKAEWDAVCESVIFLGTRWFHFPTENIEENSLNS